MTYKTTTIESYGATADQYTKNVADLAPLQSIDRFAKFLPFQARILDIGCGSGRDAKEFSDRGAVVLGIDLCPNLVEIAKRTAPKAEFQIMDIENIELPPASFDGIWAACSLHHIPKHLFPSVLSKIHELLKEGGYFYLTLKKGSGEVQESDLRYGDFEKFWAYYDEAELENLVRAAQFEILEIKTVEPQSSYNTHTCIRIFCQKNGPRA